MKKLIPFVLLMLGCISFVKAQTTNPYQKLYYVKGNDTLPYRLLLPDNYDANKKYPFILFLHGSGERGSDNESQLVHGSKLFLIDSIRKKYPAIVVFPQCPTNSFWSNVEIKMNPDSSRSFNFELTRKPSVAMIMLQDLVQQLMQHFPINQKRMYVGGLSMGGMGTFELVARNPKMFAAAFPICGGGDSATAYKMKKVSWWIFHGAKDNVVLPKYSEQMVHALQQAKAKVKFTVYPEAGHNSWDNAFTEPNLFKWLFSNKK